MAKKLKVGFIGIGGIAQGCHVPGWQALDYCEIVAAADVVPVHFTYPTTAWVPGETVEDVIDLSLRGEDPPCSYDALIILYRAADAGEVGRVTLPVGCIGE